MKKIIIASNNKGKIKEMKEKLAALNFDVISQSEAGLDIDVEETGTTFAENAKLKAEAIYNLTKTAVIADDSGLEIDYLNGEPGIYTARYAGENASDSEKMQKILNKLKDAKDSERTARFKCAICYIDENGKNHIFEQSCEGMIGKKPIGTDGFGYDPIFMLGDRSFAEFTSEEKNKISHRGKALKEFIDFLKNDSKSE